MDAPAPPAPFPEELPLSVPLLQPMAIAATIKLLAHGRKNVRLMKSRLSGP